MPHKQKLSPEMNKCIDVCLDCYGTCQQTAITHCLPLGGDYVEPEHFRLMMDCAEICRSAAALMLNGSPFHPQTCEICAQICRACADSCRNLSEMEDCVRICEECAELCEHMAASGGGRQPAKESRQAERRMQ